MNWMQNSDNKERETYLIMDQLYIRIAKITNSKPKPSIVVSDSSIENNQQHSKYKSDEYNEQLSIHKEYNRCKILLADTTGIYRFSLIKERKDVSIVEYTCYIEQIHGNHIWKVERSSHMLVYLKEMYTWRIL